MKPLTPRLLIALCAVTITPAQEIGSLPEALKLINTKSLEVRDNVTFEKVGQSVVQIPEIGAVTVYYDVTNGDNPDANTRFFFMPLVHPITDIKSVAEELSKEGEGTEVTIPVELELLSQRKTELIAENLRKIENLGDIPIKLYPVIPSYYEILMKRSDAREVVVGRWPELAQIYLSGNEFPQQSSLPNSVTVYVTDTIEGLKTFDFKFRLRALSGSVSVTKTAVSASLISADEFLRRDELYGSESLKNVVKWKNSGGGGGFMINTPVGGIGDSESSTKGSQERVLRRWVSRDLLTEAVRHGVSNAQVTNYRTEDQRKIEPEELIRLFEDWIDREIEARRFDFRDNEDGTYQLYDSVQEQVLIKEIRSGDIELKAKTENDLKAQNKSSVSAPNQVKAESDVQSSISAKSEVNLNVKEGEEGVFVPTNVKLYQVGNMSQRFVSSFSAPDLVKSDGARVFDQPYFNTGDESYSPVTVDSLDARLKRIEAGEPPFWNNGQEKLKILSGIIDLAGIQNTSGVTRGSYYTLRRPSSEGSVREIAIDFEKFGGSFADPPSVYGSLSQSNAKGGIYVKTGQNAFNNLTASGVTLHIGKDMDNSGERRDFRFHWFAIGKPKD